MTAIAPHPNAARWRGRPIVTLPLPGDAPAVAAVWPHDGSTGGESPRVACRGCGRLLRRPRPSGLGPVCERKQRVQAVRPAANADEPIPGQTLLPIDVQTALTWSP